MCHALRCAGFLALVVHLALQCAAHEAHAVGDACTGSAASAHGDGCEPELAEAAAMSVQMLQQSLRLTRGHAGAKRAPPGTALDERQLVRSRKSSSANASGAEARPLSAVGGAGHEELTTNEASWSQAHQGSVKAESSSSEPNKFFRFYTTVVKYVLLAILIVLLGFLTLYTAHFTALKPLEVEEHSRKLERSCCGLCPCRVHPEPPESDLESWEKGGKEIFGGCPHFCHFPQDLGPRQWTWRIAEINLWIQIFISANLVYESYEAPRAVLKSLQLSLAAVMLLAAICAAHWVHNRSRAILINYFFFTLVTKAFYISAKYALLSCFVTACNLAQVSFSGCFPVGPLADCLRKNTCVQGVLDQTKCKAPGMDTCQSLSAYMPAGQDIFIYDALELFFFLMGTVPVFLAATARESITALAK